MRKHHSNIGNSKYAKSNYPKRRVRRRRLTLKFVLVSISLLTLIAIGVLVVLLLNDDKIKNNFPNSIIPPSITSTPLPTPSPTPTLNFNVSSTQDTSPEAFNITTQIYKGTTQIESYIREEPIDFGPGKDYTELQGIITFRGNNYREGASYGTADVKEQVIQDIYNLPTGSVTKSGGTGAWTGSGWTGQPLIIKWPDDIKNIMNINSDKKAEPDLVEVIYPCLDGNIYFFDLKDGKPTRPTIKTGGGPTKGTASIYPSGIPMLFLGQGDALPASNPDGKVKYRIYSLIDQKLLYTLPNGNKDPNSYRKWHAYDSSALIDAKTDTFIEPGENGIFYTVKLNTKFDKSAGTLSINPDEPVKFNYTAPDYKDSSDNTPKGRWWGFEDSCAIYKNFAYVSDNGGKLMCIDLNTMKCIWVQNILDDSNSTPLFEEAIEDNTCYIYTSTSLHITATGSDKHGDIPIWKINAATGEIVWKTSYKCYTVSGVSGGVEGTGVLGKNDISDLVIYPVARTPETGSGILVALDKKTGKEVWNTPFDHYCWSSPVAVYTPEGKSYIIQCDTVGNMYLIEGKTGKILNQINLGSNIEASPAVYGDTIVVGTRGQKIYAVKIK